MYLFCFAEPIMEYKVEKAFEDMELCIRDKLNQSRYSVVCISKILEVFSLKPKPCQEVAEQGVHENLYNEEDDEDV